jgi:hypothetical protein
VESAASETATTRNFPGISVFGGGSVEVGVGEGVDVGESVSGDGTLTMSMVTGGVGA